MKHRVHSIPSALDEQFVLADGKARTPQTRGQREKPVSSFFPVHSKMHKR